MWQYIIKMWHHRNTDNADNNKNSPWIRTHLQNKIRNLYAQAPHIDTIDRFALATPMNIILQQTNTNIQRNIDRLEKRVKTAIRRTKKRLKAHNRSMTDFIQVHNVTQKTPQEHPPEPPPQQVATRLTQYFPMRKKKNDDKPP